ncbi:hypothetical protein MD484_g693, partial [Candolleomyces efflorescens]
MDSPFSEYLDSDYIPSDAETPLIKALIQQKLDAISSIDEEIKDIEDSLGALRAQRKASKIFVRKHRALIAPIKLLPSDILSTIFLACLPAVERLEASMTWINPAVVVSHVCRHWRRLAFDTPLLWSRIRLVIPLVNCDPYSPFPPADDEVDMNGEITTLFDSVIQRLLDTTTIWLTRSKGCPLTVFVEASEGAAGGFVTTHLRAVEGSILVGLGKLVDLLLTESKRWENVRFKLSINGSSSGSPLTRLLRLAPQDVPILRKAAIVINPLDSLEVPSLPGESNSAPFWDGLRLGTVHGQGLQSLALACPKAATSLKVLQVNWVGLTELSLRPYMCNPSGRRGEAHLTADEALTLLRLCPNLKRCNLAIGSGSVSWGAAPHVQWGETPPLVTPVYEKPVCRLPHLQSLILREDSRIDSLASALDLPSLHSFTQNSTIFWPRPPSHWSLEAPSEIPLMEWVLQFGHTITSLDFKHTGVPQQAVERCLEHLPNLMCLTIRSPFSESWNSNLPWGGVSACDSFLERLTPKVIEDGQTVTVNSGFLCPKLEELALNSASVLDATPVQLLFNEASVVNFLIGRAKASLSTVPEVCRVPKVRYVSIGFVKPKTMDIENELLQKDLNLEGFVGEWGYPIPLRPRSYLQTPPAGDPTMDEFSMSS